MQSVGEPPTSKRMVTICLPVRCLAVKRTEFGKSEMAGPFNWGDTIINKPFISKKPCKLRESVLLTTEERYM